jgi:Cu(I)/Ag(I) efflux system membrane fusion protein
MGVSESQIKEMKALGKISDLVEIRSPSDGFVIARAVSEGQFISVGSELYRIADIRKVWILADLFEYESRFARAGQAVKVHYLDRVYQAKITDILPQFDPVSRTFKVRLEMDNPKYIFRPEMFVDVELPVNMPKSITVPSGAVVDTGTRKTVFVEVEDGVFEPRHVETGWRFGDRIEITKGLREGERIVLSGNFLVDSESRIQLAAAGLPEDYVIDPVCGMGVNPRKAGFQGNYKGQNYYFCSADCKVKFAADPEKYLQSRLNEVNDKPEVEPRHSASNMKKSKENDSREKAKDSGTAVDPVCGMEVNIGNPGALKAEYRGETYYFCNPACRESFQKNPAKYASR